MDGDTKQHAARLEAANYYPHALRMIDALYANVEDPSSAVAGVIETAATQRTLWTIRENATLTGEVWQRFVTTTREAGTTPARVLESFITRYLAGERPDDTTPTSQER